jgi:hypothetical protein
MSAQEQVIRVAPAHLVGSRPAYRLICVRGRWVQDARRKLLDVKLKTSVLGGLISRTVRCVALQKLMLLFQASRSFGNG